MSNFDNLSFSIPYKVKTWRTVCNIIVFLGIPTEKDFLRATEVSKIEVDEFFTVGIELGKTLYFEINYNLNNEEFYLIHIRSAAGGEETEQVGKFYKFNNMITRLKGFARQDLKICRETIAALEAALK